ncbi:SRPBCC family protein [Pontibacter beigongshangensis]|uniref:SRPBCC family protein n=1 Tax=Pontibacter beigongshangensis TaxID=2574733 RepID=UPI00164EEF77|nr:SRPBCC domain-containing protein [Pontibacter beigongshangensis]
MEKQTIKLSTEINAPKDKVWDVLLQDTSYRTWTSVFHEGSYAETDWREGSKVLFKTPEGDGMVSRILVHKPSEIISIEHLGILKNGEEVFDDEVVKQWQGFKETYQVSGANGKTELAIEQDTAPEHFDFFCTAWEKALQKVKELAETNN